MNIGEAFLRNLILTVFSCILPILVGAVYLPAAKKNPKEKRIAPIIALIPESISPFIMAAMMNFLFNSSSRGTRRFFWHYPLLRQILFILSFSICFIAYIPKRESRNYSVRKDLIVNSLGLFSTVFMWSLPTTGLGRLADSQAYRRDTNILSIIAMLAISFLFVLILKSAKYWVEFHLLRDDAPKVQVNNNLSGGGVMANKSKVVSALLAFFLGTTGAHRYYLGYKKQGIVQTCGFVSIIIGYAIFIPAMMDSSAGMLIFSALLLLYGAGISIWAFVDFIRILTGGLTPADGSAYTENKPAQVQVIQAAPSPSDNIDALEKLANLYEQGILTDDEFRQKKAELLAKM